jgi:MtaA/CmuA family methyltransferase
MTNEKYIMNGYERYMAMIQGKEVDFIPRIPILMQFAAEYIGSDYAQFASDYQTLVKANVECAKEFGIDQLSCISDPYRETHGFGSEISYHQNGPPISTHPLGANKDLSLLLKPDPYQSDRMKDRISAAKYYKEKFDGKYSILGWVEGPAAEAGDLRGMIAFLMDLMEDETYACDVMDRCLEVAINFSAAQVEAGADTIGIGDAIASQVSSETYEKLIQPREKILVKAIQDKGAWVRLHICGNITHLLPGIAELGVDILDVDHMVAMEKVRNIVGERVALAGNIDPVCGVLQGNTQFIHKSVNDTYQQVGNPFMVNAGCEIPSGTPNENLAALCSPINYIRF